MQPHPFEADVVENRHDAAAHQDLAAGGVVVQPGSVVDALANEIVGVAGIDLWYADMHADPHVDRVPARRTNRVIAMALLHADGPLRGVDRVVEHQEMTVPGRRHDAAAVLGELGLDSLAMRREDRRDERLIALSDATADHLVLETDRAADVGED